MLHSTKLLSKNICIKSYSPIISSTRQSFNEIQGNKFFDIAKNIGNEIDLLTDKIPTQLKISNINQPNSNNKKNPEINKKNLEINKKNLEINKKNLEINEKNKNKNNNYKSLKKSKYKQRRRKREKKYYTL